MHLDFIPESVLWLGRGSEIISRVASSPSDVIVMAILKEFKSVFMVMYNVVWADVIADSSKFFLIRADSFCMNMVLISYWFNTVRAKPVHTNI